MIAGQRHAQAGQIPVHEQLGLDHEGIQVVARNLVLDLGRDRQRVGQLLAMEMEAPAARAMRSATLWPLRAMNGRTGAIRSSRGAQRPYPVTRAWRNSVLSFGASMSVTSSRSAGSTPSGRSGHSSSTAALSGRSS